MSTVPISLRQQFKWAWLEYQLDRPIGCIYAIPDFTPDGCGPNSLHSAIVRSLLNDPFGLADCEAAGDYHDFLYWVGGQEADRLAADKVLRRLLAATCPLSLWPNAILAWFNMHLAAGAYYTACRAFGRPYFSYRPTNP